MATIELEELEISTPIAVSPAPIQVTPIPVDYQSDWYLFMHHATDLHPVFAGNEALVIRLLTNANHVGFELNKEARYLDDLKPFIARWNDFCGRVIMIDPKCFKDTYVVERALQRYYSDIPDLTDEEGMWAACRQYYMEWYRVHAYPEACPICGAPAKRDYSKDYMCREKHYDEEGLQDLAEDTGWKCSADPSHFAKYKARKMIERMRAHGHLLSVQQADELSRQNQAHWREVYAQQAAAEV